jgi:non-specific serine/threonine protein kinase/serine/threonine-protein kinase
MTEQRFRTERQILAGLDHRNIARLLDGGTTEYGAPYVVMELVTGEPIDGYCDARNLAARDRVQIFLQVCAAVSYAHQHLVVHRDLKPNNILVTADGSVKLLDFGIAKLLDADARTDVAAADATATTLRAMTLEYASPEQVSGARVTTASDVYSLGVVLYRLLTGKSPYRERATDAARMAEILGDSMPTRPSQVERRLDGDLDNILLMALRKEPLLRYASVEQFANDLRNYLTGMPVKARGNSWRYRAGKLIRRRKVELAAGVFVACALLGAMLFSMREARVAGHERLVAQQHFDSVRKLANTMLLQLHEDTSRDAGSIKTREMMVKTSLEYLDALYQQSGSDPLLQEELATAYIQVAAILGNDSGASNRGDYQGALRSYERAFALLTPLLAAEPTNHRVGWALGSAYTAQAELLMVVRGPKFAREAAEKGVSLSETFAPSIPDEAERMLQLRAAYSAQVQILGFMGLSAEALASLDKLIAMVEAYWHAHPDDERAFLALSRAYNNAALVDDPRLSVSASYDRSVALLEKSLWADEKLLTFKPDDPEYLQRQASVRFNIGNYRYARGHYAEALELFQSATPFVVSAARDPDDASAQYTLALFETKRAQALFKTGKVEEARVLFLKCEKVLETLLARDGSLRTEYALGHNAVRLGELYAHIGHWVEARDYLQRGVASLKKVTASAKLQAIDMIVVNEGMASLARVEATLAKLQQP